MSQLADRWLTLVLIGAGVLLLGVWLLTRTRKRVFNDPELDRGSLPAGSKGLAWASLICWFGAITAGRLLAYLGPVSGLSGITNK